ncbi:hypothetical protein G7Y79_00068g095960 [Physcia stellaris]|nr:hypothetical protein G7Y79_00068g095960 [Physcia stellaris]
MHLKPAQVANMFAQSSLSSTELRRIAIELKELAWKKKEEERKKEREEYHAKMDEQIDEINETLRNMQRIAKQTEALLEISNRRQRSNRETLELGEESKKDV